MQSEMTSQAVGLFKLQMRSGPMISCHQLLPGIHKMLFRFRSKSVHQSEGVDTGYELTVNEQQRMFIVKLEEKLKQMVSTSETGYKSADKVDILCWTIKNIKRIKWIKESG
ncbi:uncharacterized protein EV154DRAFT_488157 [Mucor mucedo]|uniref:uncharacterized protein n=1 Tax=Mucor mucedo TaxID=29922 RepID=UPI00221E9B14|nr:uncharacterized protein EV154DRAFT_488157 [Mucor mucedo]KAI7868382.1 hypothetical protein EV154DRAFT_488157 [Mucor mucedo]